MIVLENKVVLFQVLPSHFESLAVRFVSARSIRRAGPLVCLFVGREEPPCSLRYLLPAKSCGEESAVI